jgi:hypothetical protein
VPSSAERHRPLLTNVRANQRQLLLRGHLAFVNGLKVRGLAAKIFVPKLCGFFHNAREIAGPRKMVLEVRLQLPPERDHLGKIVVPRSAEPQLLPRSRELGIKEREARFLPRGNPPSASATQFRLEPRAQYCFAQRTAPGR